jgi:nucleoside-diphosphate-sugar epimerase
MQGCQACISCHGSSRRTRPLLDLLYKLWDPSNEFLGAWGPSKPDPVPAHWGADFSWLDPAADPAHPWNTNYLGMLHLAEAAAAAGTVRRFVRVTGLSVSLGALHPVSLSLNLALSMAAKWHEEGERLLRLAARQGRFEYVIVRPGGLVDDCGPPVGSHLALAAEGRPVAVERVGRPDVARLCVEVSRTQARETP